MGRIAETRTGLRVAAAALALVSFATAQPSIPAAASRHDGSRSFGLRTIGIPRVTIHCLAPLRTCRHNPGDRITTGLSPVGVENNGQVVVGAALGAETSIAARYDPRSRRLVPGLAYVGWGPDFISRDGAVWNDTGYMGGMWITRGSFGKKPVAIERTHKRFGGEGIYGSLAFDQAGAAWVAGWNSHYPYGYHLVGGGGHAPGLPSIIPRGHASLFYAAPAATRFRIVSAPAPAPLTGVAVSGDGSVWAVDPYRVCLGRKGNKHCSPPLLISYDPASGRFQRFAIPRRGGFKERGGQYLSTPMTASPGGSIWIDLQSGKGYVLMRFRDGHFTTYRRWRGLEPLIVGASGNLWLTGRHGHPLVFSPSTGRTYKLREHGGKLFQSPDGQIRYVWSPSPAR